MSRKQRVTAVEDLDQPIKESRASKFWNDPGVFQVAGRVLLLGAIWYGGNALIDEGASIEAQHVVAIQSQGVEDPALGSIYNDENGSRHQAEEYAIFGTVAGIGYIATRRRRRALDVYVDEPKPPMTYEEVLEQPVMNNPRLRVERVDNDE